jgi:hypothetical protein
MSLVPPNGYVNNQFITVATNNNQPTQQARRGKRSLVRRGKGAGTRGQSTAFPSNFPPNANNVFINSCRCSGRSSAQSNRPQLSNIITIFRQTFEQLRARFLTFKMQAPPCAAIVF